MPPASFPLLGARDKIVGAIFSERPSREAVCASGLVKTTAAAPSGPEGVKQLKPVQLPEVQSKTLPRVHGLPPTVTAAPVWKPVPVSVNETPPEAGAVTRFIPVMTGAGATTGTTTVAAGVGVDDGDGVEVGVSDGVDDGDGVGVGDGSGEATTSTEAISERPAVSSTASPAMRQPPSKSSPATRRAICLGLRFFECLMALNATCLG